MTMGRRCKFSGEKAAGGTSAARHPGEANKGGPWPDGPLGDGAIPPPFARPGGMKMGDSFHGFGDGGGAKSDPGQGKRRIRITRACPKVQAGHVLAPTMESSDADGVARCVPKLCERCERASEAGARLDSSLRIPPCMGLCRTRRRKCLPLARFLRGCKVYEVTLGITTTTCDKRPKEATRHRLHSHADGVTDSPSRGRRQPDRVAGREESLLARPCAWGWPHTVGGHGRCQAHRCRCQTRRVPLSDGGS